MYAEPRTHSRTLYSRIEGMDLIYELLNHSKNEEFNLINTDDRRLKKKFGLG